MERSTGAKTTSKFEIELLTTMNLAWMSLALHVGTGASARSGNVVMEASILHGYVMLCIGEKTL